MLLTAREERGGRVARGPCAPLGVLALCGFSFAMDLVCWHYSLRLKSIAISTVLANLTPVIVTVIAWLLLRERPRPQFLAGLTLAGPAFVGRGRAARRLSSARPGIDAVRDR